LVFAADVPAQVPGRGGFSPEDLRTEERRVARARAPERAKERGRRPEDGIVIPGGESQFGQTAFDSWSRRLGTLTMKASRSLGSGSGARGFAMRFGGT
jgi:hypothetical protein